MQNPWGNTVSRSVVPGDNICSVLCPVSIAGSQLSPQLAHKPGIKMQFVPNEQLIVALAPICTNKQQSLCDNTWIILVPLGTILFLPYRVTDYNNL